MLVNNVWRKAMLLAVPLLATITRAHSHAVRSRVHLESRQTSFDYNTRTVRGVNAGGWLLTEPWITPSLYDAAPAAAVDEWTFCETLGKKECKARLSKHWATFFTQDDFNKMAAAGLNFVRIPIGYWAVLNIEDHEPYVAGQIEYLDKAITWARAAGLKVLIDLHGAPGSQNGFDNSGRRGPINWQRWFTVRRTANAFRILAGRYAKESDVVQGIEPLNEPNIPEGVDQNGLKDYYNTAWNELRARNKETTLVLHDGFLPVDSWNDFMNGPDKFVMMDTHQYQVFDPNLLAMNINQHVDTVCKLGSDTLVKDDKWTVVGEWTGALTDCAKYLNGKGIGARYDGTYPGSSYIGSCKGKTQGTVVSNKAETRRFIEAQLEVFERDANGWLFWTWKTEAAPEWDMQRLLAQGVFPQPLGRRDFGTQCPQ